MVGPKWRNAAKGLLAILIWIALYAFVQWYQWVGSLGYLIVAAPLAGILWLAAQVSKRARKFLTKKVPDTLERVFGIYEEKVDWVVYFLFVAMYGAILYFILFAPYGVLCHLGFRACGQW